MPPPSNPAAPAATPTSASASRRRTLGERAEHAIARSLMRLPSPMIALLLVGRRKETEGLPLDPVAQLSLELYRKSGRKPLHTFSPAAARIEFAKLMPASDLAPLPVAEVIDRTIPGPAIDLPIRIYRPRPSELASPALVYYHGGGFVIGGLDTHDAQCRAIALGSGAIVVSVDYRLAPEHKFPAAVDDAFAAFSWVAEHARELGIDPARIGVGGDSAGGNLSAVVAQLARDGGPKPAAQLLIYPAVDLERRMASHQSLAAGYFLTRELIDWFITHYVRTPADFRDPRGSPILTEGLRGLPPAIVVTGGFDPLRDEGRAYAERLRLTGVRVEHLHEPGMIHGFWTMAGVSGVAKRAMDRGVSLLGELLSEPSRV